MKVLIKFSISFCLFFATSICRADDMTVFLKSCAVGTAAGALVGLATVALSENPNDRTGNIARGASLGLYAGIGFGLYTLYGPQRGQMEFTQAPKNPVWFSALHSEGRIDGAQVNWAHLSF